MKQWDTLRRIKDLQLYLNSLPGVDKTISFVDFVEVIDNALQSLPPEEGAEAPPPPEKKTTFWDNPAQLPDALQMVFLAPSHVHWLHQPSQLLALEYSRAYFSLYSQRDH